MLICWKAKHIYICDEHKNLIQHLRSQQKFRESPRTGEFHGDQASKSVQSEVVKLGYAISHTISLHASISWLLYHCWPIDLTLPLFITWWYWLAVTNILTKVDHCQHELTAPGIRICAKASTWAMHECENGDLHWPTDHRRMDPAARCWPALHVARSVV